MDCRAHAGRAGQRDGQYHPDYFCDPRSAKYREQYAELARRCTGQEIRSAYRHARERGLNFESITFERAALERYPVAPAI